MPFVLRHFTKVQIIAGSFIVLTSVTALGLSGYWFANKSSARQQPAILPSKVAPVVVAAEALSRTPQDRKKVEVEIVTLKATGFDPSSLTRPKGEFMLVIENRSGLPEVTFQFDRAVGLRLRQARVARKKASWNGLVDLPPGTYKMTEATRPAWAFSLIITPN